MEEKNSHTVPEFERRKRKERERERTKNVTYNDHTIRLLTISLSDVLVAALPVVNAM